MPSFEWIPRDWESLTDGFENAKKISLDEFLRRSGIDEEPDWLALAQQWGRKQSPEISVELQPQDLYTVVLHKRQ